MVSWLCDWAVSTEEVRMGGRAFGCGFSKLIITRVGYCLAALLAVVHE